MLGGTNSNSQLIKNLDVTLTENGTFVSGEDYTGFGTVTVAVPPDVMDAELKVTPTKEDGTSLDPTYDEYTGPFTDPATGIEYAGAGHIKVRKIGSWIDAEISADNIRKDHVILGVKGNLIELVPQVKTTKSTTTQFTLYPDQGYNGLSSVTINPMILQEVTHVTPKSYSVTVYKGSGYDGMNSVQIDAVTAAVDSNIQPENIKKNVTILGVRGTYDNYVAPVVQGISIDPTISDQTITPPAGVDGFNKVSVSAVTSAIDSNIRPENIKRNVAILGVVGSYKIENLQDKTVTPMTSVQTVTFDDTYEGLGTVTVNAVTSSIDPNIQPENIKKDVTILGVVGTAEGEKVEIEPAKVVAPSTSVVTVTPSAGYDAMSEVDISAVTASIDPNILAENIKKNIEILGVTGNYEGILPNYQQSKTIEPSGAGDVTVNPDVGYDALLKVIVKAVTASIDPNIIPKNIRKDVSILGITGTLEEGLPQQWFYFKDTQAFNTLGQVAYSEGGNDIINKLINVTGYKLEDNFDRNYDNLGNFRANFFGIVYGYDDEYVVDPITYDSYIYFANGRLYVDYDKLVTIPDQTRYFYPFVNNYGVKGLTIGLDEDDGSERIMKLYVLTDSTEKFDPVPVLVNGELNLGMIPSDYDGFRFVKDIVVPQHKVFIPKTKTVDNIQWVLRDEDTITTKLINKAKQPDIIEVSAYDINYGQIDLENDIIGSYKLKDYNKLKFNPETYIATQTTAGETGYIQIPGTIEKKDNYTYYFKFKINAYSGYSQYFTLFECNSLFRLGLYRQYDYGYYYVGYVYRWNSATSGDWTTWGRYLYTGNIYWFRVRVSGTHTYLDYSADGSSWENFADVNSSYINPTNTNTINIYSLAGPNNDLYADGLYITNSTGNRVYSVLEPQYIKQTSHEIVDLDNDNLLVTRDTSRYSVKYQGDERYDISSFNSSTKLLDMGTNGNIEIQNGFNVTNKTWEICQHFRLTSVIGNNNRHLASWPNLESATRRNCLWIDTGNCICWRIYYNSGGNAIVDGRLNNTALTVGTDYYIKYGWNGSTYYMYISTSPTFNSYVTSWTANSTSTTYCDTSKLLIGNWTYNATNGSMRYLYLDDYTYVKVNNEIIWRPKHEELYGNIVNYTDDGSPVTLDAYLTSSNLHGKITNADIIGNVQVNKDGTASGFSTGNYLQLPEAFNPGNNPWEVYAKVVTGSSVTSEQDIFGVITDENLFRVGLASTVTDRFQILVANGGKWINTSNHYGTYSVLANTTYWIKAGFDGIDTYYLDYSLDGETYIRDVVYTSSTKIGVVSNIYTTISSGLSNVNVSWTGSVDLSEMYIKINNEIWWQPNIVQTYDYDWIFTQDENWTYTGLTNLGKKGELIVPEHNIYQWNQSKMKWEGLKQLTFNIIDEDEFYTNVIEN